MTDTTTPQQSIHSPSISSLLKHTSTPHTPCAASQDPFPCTGPPTSRWSMSRPGVATSSVTPLRRRAFSWPLCSPPIRMPGTSQQKRRTSAVNTSDTCSQPDRQAERPRVHLVNDTVGMFVLVTREFGSSSSVLVRGAAAHTPQPPNLPRQPTDQAPFNNKHTPALPARVLAPARPRMCRQRG